MTLEELLEKEQLHPGDINRFLKQVEIKTLKKADLDLIIKKFGPEVLEMGDFEALYDLKVKESNKRLLYWMLLIIILSGSLGAWRILRG